MCTLYERADTQGRVANETESRDQDRSPLADLHTRLVGQVAGAPPNRTPAATHHSLNLPPWLMVDGVFRDHIVTGAVTESIAPGTRDVGLLLIPCPQDHG